MVFLIFIVLVTLKLDYEEGSIDYLSPFFDSWWAVFSPIWFILGFSFCYTCFCGDASDFAEVHDDDDNPLKTEEDISTNIVDEAISTPKKSDDDQAEQPHSDPIPLSNQKKEKSRDPASAPKQSTSSESANNPESKVADSEDTGSGGVSDLPHPEEAKSDTYAEEDNPSRYFVQGSSNSPGLCLQVLVIATTLIFCAKLDHDQKSTDDTSFSSFWIAVPLLFFPVSV